MFSPAPFNGGMPCRSSGRCTRSGVQFPLLPPNFRQITITRQGALILARLVPVRTPALGADSRFSLRILGRHPLMGATITFIPFFLDRDHAHERNNILAGNRCDSAKSLPDTQRPRRHFSGDEQVRLAKAMPHTSPEFWLKMPLNYDHSRLRKAGSSKSNRFRPRDKRS